MTTTMKPQKRTKKTMKRMTKNEKTMTMTIETIMITTKHQSEHTQMKNVTMKSPIQQETHQQGSKKTENVMET